MKRKKPNPKKSRNVSPSKALAPGIITVVGSMMMTTQSFAVLFAVDSAGNAQPTSADNGETTIIASGGTSATPFVTIDGTINMNGDNGEAGVIVISGGSPYTVNIASGGTLAANTFQDGINVVNGTFATINNNGTITGMGDGIDFGNTGGLVNNNLGGIITGGNRGINAEGSDNLTVVNRGSITGNSEDESTPMMEQTSPTILAAPSLAWATTASTSRITAPSTTPAPSLAQATTASISMTTASSTTTPPASSSAAMVTASKPSMA